MPDVFFGEIGTLLTLAGNSGPASRLEVLDWWRLIIPSSQEFKVICIIKLTL